MLMVILGAGASYDSAASFPIPRTTNGLLDYPRPPLASQLFSHIDRFAKVAHGYPAMLAIVDRLRIDTGNVEETLQRFRDESAQDSDRMNQLMAVKFYLRDILTQCSDAWNAHVNGATNYCTLIDYVRCSRKRTCFVTFNYDLLLERALKTTVAGFECDRIADYVRHSRPFQVFKLHGSVDWLRIVPRSPHPQRVPVPHEIIAAAHEFPSGGELITLAEARTAEPRSWAVPGLAIPVREKKAENDFECPSLHLAELKKIIPEIDEILIIGWKAQEEHFFALLKKGLKKIERLSVVDANEPCAASVANTFKRKVEGQLENTSVRLAKLGFSAFVRSKEIQDVLS